MKTLTTNRTIRELLTAIRNEILVPSPEFQRDLVWSNKHKSAFIETVLQGYPFPEIYIAAADEVDPDTGEAIKMLVDGQQRLTTLYQYFSESQDLKLTKGITPYSDLTHEKKVSFLKYEVVVRDLGQTSIIEIKEILERINSINYSLNAMEINNARFDGEIKQFAEEFSQDSFFAKHRVFSKTDGKSMNDVSFALSVVITTMLTYFNLEKEFESFLYHYNNEFEEKQRLETEFQEVFQFIDECSLPDDCRAWRKSDLFTLLVEIHRALFKEKNNVNPIEVGKQLLQFYELVDKSTKANEEVGTEHSRIQEYYKAAIQGTQSRSNRIRRGKIIQDVINGDFKFEKKEK